MNDHYTTLIDAVYNFKDKKVLVIGDVMLDTYWMGSVNRSNPEHIVITLSEDGIYYHRSINGKNDIIPTQARSVSDVTSAGDTVISTLALANLDLNIHNSTELANIAAGIVVENLGTYSTSREELISKLDSLSREQ